MSLLNLTLVEFLAVLLPLSGMLVALYFYDRSRKRRIVSTLRFWPRRAAPPMTTRRRKLQQPLSLLLQLLALLLLLLAIADLRFGGDGSPPRHHVVVLETSAWMNATNGGSAGGTLMEGARRQALAYLRAIPLRDPVMLIRADAVPTPATGFTTDRQALEQAIRDSTPGWTAARLADALDAARSALQLATGAAQAEPGASPNQAPEGVGEVAYIGSGRIPEGESGLIPGGIPFLRFIPVGEETGDVGFRRFAAHPASDDPSRWQVVVEAQNYDAKPRPLRVDFSFNERPIGSRSELLPARSSHEITFSIRTERPGVLQAAMASKDEFRGNNTVSLRLPGFQPHALKVYSAQPGPLRTLLNSVASLQPEFLDPRRYSASGDKALMLFDGFAPAETPSGIYLDPPAAESPVAVARVARDARITQWTSGHPLAEGLHSKDLVLEQSSVFELGPGDVPIAETEAGPVIVARSNGSVRCVVFGFHPARQGMENRLAAPLLFANAVRWFLPEVFRSSELRTQPPGVVETPVGVEREEEIALFSPENPDLPWRLIGDRVRFFAARPGLVTVRTPQRESQFELTLAEVGPVHWEPPAGTRRGIPPPIRTASPENIQWWPWLSAAALACLLLEWRLYGRAGPAGAATFAPVQPQARAGQALSGLGASEPEAHESGVRR